MVGNSSGAIVRRRVRLGLAGLVLLALVAVIAGPSGAATSVQPSAYWPMQSDSLDVIGTAHGTDSAGVAHNQAGITPFGGTSTSTAAAGSTVNWPQAAFPLGRTTGEWSLSAWVKVDGGVANSNRFWEGLSSGGLTGDARYFNTSSSQMCGLLQTNVDWSRGHHFGVVQVGNAITVYWDGAATGSCVLTSRSMSSTVGTQLKSGWRVQAVRFWNTTAITASDMMELFQSDSTTVASPSTTAAPSAGGPTCGGPGQPACVVTLDDGGGGLIGGIVGGITGGFGSLATLVVGDPSTLNFGSLSSASVPIFSWLATQVRSVGAVFPEVEQATDICPPGGLPYGAVLPCYTFQDIGWLDPAIIAVTVLAVVSMVRKAIR